MTADQMYREVELVYESIASQNAAGYTVDEWTYILTEAQEKVVKDIVEQGFDKNDFTRLDLKALVKIFFSEFEFTTTSLYNNGWVLSGSSAPNPEDIFGILNERINLSDNITVIPIDHDYYDANVKNPFTKPNSDRFWRIMTADTFEGVGVFINDGINDPYDYNLEYISRPEPIVITGTTSGITIDGYLTTGAKKDCLLSTRLHRQIVEVAARLAHNYTQDQIGYKIKTVESQQKDTDN